jgi:hypothetical protein
MIEGPFDSEQRSRLRRRRAAAQVVISVALVGQFLAGAVAFGASPQRASSLAAVGSIRSSAQKAPQKPVSKNATFGVQPASATKPDSRGYFTFSATPGARISDYFAVTNYSLRPLTLTVHATDALNTPEGDFALLAPNQPVKEVGMWISVPTRDRKIVVAGRTSRIVPFRIAIPSNAMPGDHVGGITVILESTATSPTGQKYRLLQAVGSRVFVRVSGPLHPGLAVEALSVRYHGTWNPIGRGRADVIFTVRNVGNVALGGRQTVRISGLFGFGSSAVGLPQLGVLLPGSAITETVHVHGVVPQIWMTARVSIKPLILPGSVQPITGPYQGSNHFWAGPWVWLAIIALLALVIRFRARRRRRTTPTDKLKRRAPSSGHQRDGAHGHEVQAGASPRAIDGSGTDSGTAT